MTLTDRTLINNMLHEFHDSVASGNLSDDRKLERVKTCSWWPNWRKETVVKKKTEPQEKNLESPWQIVHLDWVTALPPGGDKSYHACLVLVDRYSTTPMLLPFHKYDTPMDTAIMIWNEVISHTGLFQNITSDRDPKFTSELWTNLQNLFGTKL
ncbi:hypothetical protein O181_083284 [Austropuccinia psidii MF-1]|uniref:Integrase catalytic domain-containing protein n=1 Tax=Austropuccinia psidii MF-1 TaxID=1389203 RepID=A0A9Q3FQW6_9BASI|nr:hypothetical protein [Austropuccinia psidii MF-1]